MTKKRKMTDYEREFSKNAHDHDDPQDTERGTTRRESAGHATTRKKSGAQVKRRLRDLARPDDAETRDDEPVTDGTT
jgi:hypothetical protein